MKKTIAWHQACLKHWQELRARKEAEIARLLQASYSDIEEITHYQRQIEQAIKEEKDGFDRNKFLKGRKAI